MFNGNGAIVGQINRIAPTGPNIGPIGGGTQACPLTGCPITDPGGAPAAPPPAPPPTYSPPAVPPGGGGAPPPSGPTVTPPSSPSPGYPSPGYPSGTTAPWTPPAYGPYGPGPLPGQQGLPPGVYTQDTLFGQPPAQSAPAAPVDKTDVMALPEALRRTVIDAMSRGTNPEAIDKLADALIGAGFSKAGRRLRGIASALRVTESALVGQYWGRTPGIPQLRPQIGPFDFSGRPAPPSPPPAPAPPAPAPIAPVVPVLPRPGIDPYLVRVSPLAGIRWMAVKLVEPTKDMLPRDGTGMPVVGTEMSVLVRGFGDYVTDPSPVHLVRVRVVRRSSITRNGATARFLVGEIVDVAPKPPGYTVPGGTILPLPMNGDLVLID